MFPRRFRRGLVVGKFSPLHRGHMLVLETALAQCAEVIVLSYTAPEFPRCESAQRERWLRALFPHAIVLVPTAATLPVWLPGQSEFSVPPANDASEDRHRRFCAALVRDHLGTSVDAVFTSEDYGDGFAAVLTKEFRARDPQALPVTHVCVDRARDTVPISGTQLRADVHAHRAMLHPEVYADFVERVCFLGAESTGKSTLAAALASEFDTVHVPEFGRELWITRDGALRFEDFRTIVETQIAHEEAALRKAYRFLFCDTSPLTTLSFQREMCGRADPEVEHAAAQRIYDHVFLCAPDFPFVQDGTRQDESFRQRQHAWYETELAARKIPHVVLHGPLAQRRQAARHHLDGLSPIE